MPVIAGAGERFSLRGEFTEDIDAIREDLMARLKLAGIADRVAL